MYINFIKPIFDFCASLVILIITSPIILLLALVMSIFNKGNPFFIQKRPGKKGNSINIIKFKTMTNKIDDNGKLLPDSQRLTRIGKFLRKTSLDELPQFVNVLIGDMSLVGPRPLLFDYIPLYSEEQSRRHDVRPGITGWAQVNGRNAISWTKKFSYDIWYVDNVSFSLDMKILLLTIKKVLSNKNTEFSLDEGNRRFNGNN